MTTAKHLQQAGNTLIELLIATVIVGLVLTAVAMTMMYSIHREATNRYREYATQLAVEAGEQLYLERAILGWQGFRAKYFPGSGATQWCFYYADLDSDPSMISGECLPANHMEQFGTAFKTDITMTQEDASKLVAEIIVTANVDDTQNAFEYRIEQFYTEREY